MSIIILSLLALGLLTGLLLAITGWRGKPVAGTRICSDCGFDVLDATSQPKPIARCPECGSDVLQRGGWKVARKRRMGRAVIGVTLASLCSAGTILIVAASTSPMSALPVWLLHWNLTSSNVALRDDSTAELARRAGTGSLTPADLQSLAPTLLRLQGDTELPWSIAWGELIEAAASLNVLTPAQQEQYLRQSFDLSIRHSVRVRPNQQLSIGFDVPRPRVGNMPVLGTIIIPPNEWLAPDHRQNFGVAPTADGAMQIPLSLDVSPRGISRGYSIAAFVKAASGRHEVRHAWRVALSSPGWPVVEVPLDKRTRLEVIEGVGPLATPVASPMPAAFVASLFSFHHTAGNMAIGLDKTEGLALNLGYSARGHREPVIVGMCSIKPTPQDLAFELFIRPAGDESHRWSRFISVSRRSGDIDVRGIGGMPAVPPPALFAADAVDVLLRSSAQVADDAIDMSEYWPGEVIIPNVPLDKSPLFTALEQHQLGSGSPHPASHRIHLLQAATAASDSTINWPAEIDQLLKKQANTTRQNQAGTDPDAWSSDDADLLEYLRGKGKVTDDQYTRYLQQIVPAFTLQMRPRVRLDDQGGFAIASSSAVYRTSLDTKATVVWDQAEVWLNDQRVTSDNEPRIRYLPTAQIGHHVTFMSLSPIRVTQHVEPGTYTLRVRRPYRVFAGEVSHEQLAVATPPLVAASHEASTQVQVLATDEPIVLPVPDDTIAATLDASLTCTSVWYNFTSYNVPQRPFGGVQLQTAALPVAVAFDTYVQPQGSTNADERWFLGRVVLGPGENRTTGGGDNMPPTWNPQDETEVPELANPLPDVIRAALQAGNVELVVRPNPLAGESRQDVAEVWIGDGKERIIPVKRVRNMDGNW